MRSMKRTVAIAAGLLAFAGARARAAFPGDEHRVLPCRPTIACTADLVPPGSLEIEMGIATKRASNAALVHSDPLLLKLTLFEWAQLQVGTNGRISSSVDHREKYVDRVDLGLKVHVHDQTQVTPSLAFSFSLSVPSWDAAPGRGSDHDALAIAYVTKDFGWLHLDLNLGVAAFAVGHGGGTQPFVALASSAALNRVFGVMLEEYFFADASPLAPKDAGVLFALTHSPRPWLMFDFGGDVGLFPSTRAWTAFVGATIIPWDFWDERGATKGVRSNVHRPRSSLAGAIR